MALETYRKKRDFSKTPEPAGTPDEADGRMYVIQKHAARALHYDFRIELDGVLLSWAVPKGPSLDPHDKHLAVRVEDHPVEYGDFEGVIPKGEYGGGTVELWDRGWWEPVGDPHKALEKGDLKFTLHGEKLQGSWVLARMRKRSEAESRENWLLIKHRDEFAVDGDGAAILTERAESVASGRTIEEIAADADSTWHSDLSVEEQTEVHSAEEARLDPSAVAGAVPAKKLPRFVQPELATLVKKAPEGDEWLHEVKFDGYRAVARVEGGRVTMSSRNDKDWTDKFKPVADVLATLPVDAAMLDGEVVVTLPDGTTSFQELQHELGAGPKGRLVYYAFDLLHLDGWDLTGAGLEDRRALLARLLHRLPADGKVRFSDAIVGNGEAFRLQACEHTLEGVVSKRSGSVYRPGVRGNEWLKSKCLQRQEFVIVGWSDPSGTRVGFGALLLAVNDPDGKLRYIGKVGTGFNDKLLSSLGERLRKMEVAAPPVARGAERAPKGSHWARPELVCEVAFFEWTADGDIRHQSFQGLREDKSPAEVRLEQPKPTEEAVVAASETVAETASARSSGTRGKSGRGPSKRDTTGDTTSDTTGDTTGGVTREKPSRPRSAKQRGADGEVLGVTLTHPGRVFWPEDGVTKQELADYYASIADRMLPYVLHRPVSMVRCPEGVAGVKAEVHQGQPGPCFFHKHPSRDFKGPFERVMITESGGPQPYLTVTEPGSLVALAQNGVLEVHIWGSTWPDIEHPDMMVFDLDPSEEVGFAQLAEGARLIRGVLGGLGLESFVKTTGGKGLHIVVPLRPSEDWDGVKRFSKAVADAIVAYAPDKYVSTMSKSKRVGKVFVDYLRNTRGSTFIAPFSTRAKPHATVSVPLRWEELGGRIRPDSFTIRNLHRRLSRLKADPWQGFLDLDQTITAEMKRDIGL